MFDVIGAFSVHMKQAEKARVVSESQTGFLIFLKFLKFPGTLSRIGSESNFINASTVKLA